MKKSKEFIIERGHRKNTRCSAHWVMLKHFSGRTAYLFCQQTFNKHFNTKLKPGERKRIKITIEEIKK